MRHSQARRMLAARSYLVSDEEERLDAHLRSCDACRAVEEEFRRQDVFLSALSADGPPSSLRRAVLTASPQAEDPHGAQLLRPATWAHRLPASLLTAAALVVIVASAVLHARPTQHGGGPQGPIPQGTSGSPAALMTVSHDTSQGLRITLSAPADIPKDALMRVTVRVTNTSQHSIPIRAAGSAIGASILTNAQTGAPAPNGTFGTIGGGIGDAYVPPRPLAPGASSEKVLYGIAAGRYLRASVGAQDRNGHAIEVAGPTVVLTLTGGTAPFTTFRTRPQAALTILPSTGAGPLLYNGTASCLEDNGDEHQMGMLYPGWATSVTPTLTAQWPTTPNFNGTCTHDFEWHVTAGYVGEPAVQVDYIAPAVEASAGAAVPLRRTTCGASRPITEEPYVIRHAAGEGQVVRAACSQFTDSAEVEVASMALGEWQAEQASAHPMDAGRWVWVVVVHGPTSQSGSARRPISSFAYDGVSGRRLGTCGCDWLGATVLNGAAPTAQTCPTPGDGFVGRGVVVPGNRHPAVRFSPGFVPNRMWEGTWQGYLLVIASGHRGNGAGRGIIEVRSEARCTGIAVPGPSGDYPTPKRVGVPTLRAVNGSIVTFTSKAGIRSFSLTTKAYSTTSTP